MTRASDTARLVSGGAVINEASNDVDFRVESNGQTHALFVDAGNDHVNINTDSDLGSTLNVNGEITCANANAGLLLVENAADANGSNFTMRKSRNTTLNGHTVVQDGDTTGNINFQGSDGDEFLSTASIASTVDGTPGNNDMPGKLVFKTTRQGESSPVERMSINKSGQLLFNTQTNVFGNEGVRFFPAGSSNGTLCEFMNDDDGVAVSVSRGGGDGICQQFRRGSTVVGSVSVTSSNTAFNTSSDYRLKENVQTDWDATTRLKQLKPSRFSWIVDKKSEPTQDGFLAHEVSNIVPEAVTGTKDEVEVKDNPITNDKKGDPVYQSIDQSKLVPLLTKSLQEALARIDTLEAEVAKLKG